MLPIKGELGSELGVLGPEERDLGIFPDMILHSFSGGRSTYVMSTGFKGKVDTSHTTLEAKAIPYPPGTFLPFMRLTDIRSIMDL